MGIDPGRTHSGDDAARGAASLDCVVDEHDGPGRAQWIERAEVGLPFQEVFIRKDDEEPAFSAETLAYLLRLMSVGLCGGGVRASPSGDPSRGLIHWSSPVSATWLPRTVRLAAAIALAVKAAKLTID